MRRAFLALALAATVVAQEATTVAELFGARQQSDGKHVLVGGLIKGYSEQPDRTTFLLMDEGKLVSVYLPRKAGYANGEKAIVTGTFHMEKKLGGKVMTNVIEATHMEPAQE